MDNIILTDSLKAFKRYIQNNAFSSITILVDENSEKYCLPLLDLPVEYKLIRILSGEKNKTINTCMEIWEALTDQQADRNALLVNLGGGVIGDMGGFCAATYKRGISFVNIPTTLLAMVDASVGGKLGVDFNGYKNHVGLFREPDKVFIDSSFLKTLPKNQVMSGFAEVIKHGLIADSGHWKELMETPIENMNWDSIISSSVKIKLSVVKSDFLESGMRKSLNFGHTIGHAIESYLLNTEREILHGEAVAAGIILESYLSEKVMGLSEENNSKIRNFIVQLYSAIDIRKTDYEGIKSIMKQDKKNTGREIKYTLITKPGEAKWDCKVPEELVGEALDYYIESYT